MKKVLFVVCFLLLAQVATPSLQKDDLVDRLGQMMKNRDRYDLRKEERILKLKREKAIAKSSEVIQYEINDRIYNEYKKYIIDSAINYVLKNKELVETIGDYQLQQKVVIELALLYSTKGMYLESKELLVHVNTSELSQELIPLYYESYSAFYSHYGQSTNTISYFYKSELYRDSLLEVLPRTTLKYQIAFATKQLYGDETKKAEN